MLPVIMSIAGDPGGANALLPVLHLLRQEAQVKLINCAYYQALEYFIEQAFHPLVLPEVVDIQFAITCLQQHQVSFLLTATSVNDKEWEKVFIKAAKHLQIPSLSILDFWSNYAQRFMDSSGVLNLPDKIAVMDELAYQGMIAAGISRQNLLITGQPAFDSLAVYRSAFSEESKQALKINLGMSATDLLVVFLSQPIKNFYGTTLGFDEVQVLSKVIPALEHIAEKIEQPITLLIRPHPREDLQDYAHYESAKIKIRVSQSEEPKACMMAAHVVVGMNTVLLVEACYLGCVVLSLQPGLRGVDSLPTNALGLSQGVFDEALIAFALEEALLKDEYRQSLQTKTAQFVPLARAAHNIASQIYIRLDIRKL